MLASNKRCIDAFLITEEIMADMECHAFVIGVPVWGSWMVWHMLTHPIQNRQIGKRLSIKDR